WVIGGQERLGQGWRMLMQSLAAGRAISLPSMGVAGGKMASMLTGAYARIRTQFNVPIGYFGGVEEPLSRIGGRTYRMDAARVLTLVALDQGEKPGVLSAINKYQLTEGSRQCITDAMDVHGGKGIIQGPNNYLARAYQTLPIAITVEGANILTRTLMIFGQGAIRCHPYAYAELDAIQRGDQAAFDQAFWPHVGHVVSNGVRSALLGLTRGWLTLAPGDASVKRYWRKLNWASAEFALLADVAMGALGGDLKRKEKLTGRYADWFSWLFLGAAVLRRFEAEGRRREDLPLVEHALDTAFANMQTAREGIHQNLSLPVVGNLLGKVLGLYARLYRFGAAPSDRVTHAAAKALLQPGAQRDRISGNAYVPSHPESALGTLEHAMERCCAAEPVIRKLKDAVRAGRLPKARPAQLLDQATEAGILTAAERELAQQAEAARAEAIAVDSFTLAEYLQANGGSRDQAIEPSGAAR
ncbi:MAG: DUF1974 domain-containing protein, partial [Planctomycetes bacterium]|nr:DUF1974 domain-containing protein [Planctomycetota bacterium]